jgi:hypothetical protein
MVGFARCVAGIVLIAMSLMLGGCGVRFRDPEPGTEFFTAIEITGEKVVGAPLTVLVEYEQYYPVDVQFHCELRREKEIIKQIGERSVAPLDDGGPDKTPIASAYAFDFTVDEPGTFIVECLTELDEDNFIGDEIEIRERDDGDGGS